RLHVAADHSADQPPELVAGMGVIAAARERLLARQASEQEQPGPRVDNRREGPLEHMKTDAASSAGPVGREIAEHAGRPRDGLAGRGASDPVAAAILRAVRLDDQSV